MRVGARRQGIPQNEMCGAMRCTISTGPSKAAFGAILAMPRLGNRQPKQFGTFLTHNRPNAKRADVGLGAEKEFPVELIYHFRRAATSQ